MYPLCNAFMVENFLLIPPVTKSLHGTSEHKWYSGSQIHHYSDLDFFLFISVY